MYIEEALSICLHLYYININRMGNRFGRTCNLNIFLLVSDSTVKIANIQFDGGYLWRGGEWRMERGVRGGWGEGGGEGYWRQLK